MNKKLTPKIVLIIFLVVAAVLILYPPQKKLNPGIDLAGGTSLIYEIDAQGLDRDEQRGLSDKMITVLRRRVDPANIRNLLWRPLGNTRFEIQMPLSSQEARDKRLRFEQAKDELFADNVSRVAVLRSLKKPKQERTKEFEGLSQGDPNRLEILNDLGKAYDDLKTSQDQRDSLYTLLQEAEKKISSAGIDMKQVEATRNDWTGLEEGPLKEAVQSFLGSEDNVDVLMAYVKTYREWDNVTKDLLAPITGKKDRYRDAERAIDRLNLTEDQLKLCLESPKSTARRETLERLKAEFPGRVAKIDSVLSAYKEYSPYRGRLDDPEDLKRMLKGAGILEFRIVPTASPEVNADRMNGYLSALKEKGPEYASDSEYVWHEIEDIEEWRTSTVEGEKWKVSDAQGYPPYVGTFGDKYYVLASNQTDECLLHGGQTKPWKLTNSRPTTDTMGRRAIGFSMDERGAALFGNVTGKNIGRPLCILLDGIAISAPNIESRIRRQGVITGRFSETEVKDMANKLNAGSLPSKLIEQPISENTIGPSIGANNRDEGIKAGFIGLIAVMLTMAIYYTFAGSIADIALLMNILFVLAMMAFLRATFTLPGIAGIILTIGMSVDANVLIFERIREEQEKGSSLRIAIANGYQRAFRTIVDANLTTFITAAILYWRASEEIKGFAIVLMLGIISSMFTALFVTRVVFDSLLSRRIIKDHLLMLRLIHKPNVNWMAVRPVFLAISLLLVTAGLFVFFTRNDKVNNKYDIEFTGGTSVQTNFKKGVRLTRQDVEDRISAALASASVYSVGEPIGEAPNGDKIYEQYEINTGETNKITVTVTLAQGRTSTIADLTAAIKKAQDQARSRLSNLVVTADNQSASMFTVATSQMNQSVVKEVLATAFPQAVQSEPVVEEIVNDAILSTFAQELQVRRNLGPSITAVEKITEQETVTYPELADFLDGVRLVCELSSPASAAEIEQRLRELRFFKRETWNLEWYDYRILDGKMNAITDANEPLQSFAYVSVYPEVGFRQLSEEQWTQFIENERQKVTAVAELETSLPRVRQFDPSVGAEAQTRALIAIVLSLFAIIAYIWARFGDVRYGIAAIVALVHDVCITLGAVVACTYIASSSIGEALLIGDFKINLAIIAAFLTLIGYSLNDTIVVFDRIRENRHKAQLRPQTISDSINQTISRTILTSFTTFIVVLIMYIFGGPGLRGFTFAIGLGVIVGTYSSIAIAAPILLLGTKTKKGKKK